MKRLIWNRHTKLVLKQAAGWVCLVAGIIMLITPGQGLLTILLGIFLLAEEIPLFGKLRDRIHRKFPKAVDLFHRKAAQIRAYWHSGNEPD